MSRYRPPQPKASPYITPQGYQSLQDELGALWRRRGEVTRALAAAAAEGDRSENAEYIYRKKELREIDRRIRYLQKRLPALTVVSEAPGNRSQVFFGAWITVADEDGRQQQYRIVGPDEFDIGRGYLSMDAPMARALMKRQVDDEVEVMTPDGMRRFVILEVSYQHRSPE